MRNTNGEVYVPSRLLKKAKSPLRHRVTESQRREGFRTYQKCQQILTLFVLIFLCVSVSLWLRLVFHQPAKQFERQPGHLLLRDGEHSAKASLLRIGLLPTLSTGH